jgi:hypothetical protein
MKIFVLPLFVYLLIILSNYIKWAFKGCFHSNPRGMFIVGLVWLTLFIITTYALTL